MTDSSLIEKLRSGSREELNLIYNRHREEFIQWLCSAYKTPEEEAKDIYQFSVLKLYDNVVDGRLSTLTSSIKTYLFSIGKNKALEYNRSASKNINPAYELHLDDESAGKKLKEEQLIAIENGLRELGEPCSSLLKMFYYQCLKMDEITVNLGYKNSDTTKNQKYKCLQRLRKIALHVTISNHN